MLTLAHFSASVALLWHPLALLFRLHDAAVVRHAGRVSSPVLGFLWFWHLLVREHGAHR